MKRSTSGSNLQVPPAGMYTHSRSQSGSRMSLAHGTSSSRPAQPIFTRSSSTGLGFGMGVGLTGGGYDGGATMSGQRPGALGQSARKSIMPLATPARAIGFRTPAQDPLGRRSSVFSGRPSNMNGAPMPRESFFSTAPVAAAVTVDPRRLRDAAIRNQMVQDLQEYLQRNNYELETGVGLTAKCLTSPTQKEFATMFKWLYNQVDPSYKFQKNLDAEIPPLLKQLRYPFEKSITKSQITAVGGNNWHTFLGLLHWLMQLSIMMEAYNTGNYDDACLNAGIDVKCDRIIYRFMTEGYAAWLSVDDSAPEEEANSVVQLYIERMAAEFGDANKDLISTIEMLAAERKTLEDQIEELEQEADHGQKLDKKAEVINSDIAKYSAWIDKVEQKRRRNEDKTALLSQDLSKLEEDLGSAQREQAEYQDALSRQGITIQDLDRMTAELERLEIAKAAVLSRSDEARARHTEHEMEASSKLDELERTVANYNSLAYKIGLIPPTAPNAKGQDFELSLTVNPNRPPGLHPATSPAVAAHYHLPPTTSSPTSRLLNQSASGYMPYQLLNLDLNTTVRPGIAGLRKAINERQDHALEQQLKNHSLLDRVSETVDDKRAEVDSLRHRIRAADEEYEKIKDTTSTQKVQMDAQIERMDKELAKLRQSLTESVQLVEQREINMNLEYEQLTIHVNALREELHTQIERILNDIIHFKLHISKKLEDYEAFIQDQVEDELTRAEQNDQAGLGGAMASEHLDNILNAAEHGITTDLSG